MRAQAGDRLLAASGGSSVGLIVEVLGEDGQPPYVVKWLRSGHLAMVVPDQYARIMPTSRTAGIADTAGGGDTADDGQRSLGPDPAGQQ